MRFCVRLLFDLQFASVGLPMSQNIKASTVTITKIWKKPKIWRFFQFWKSKNRRIKKDDFMDTHQYISECLTFFVFFQIARKCDISWRDLKRHLNLNRDLKPHTYYYDGLAGQPSDIRWLRGPRTSFFSKLTVFAIFFVFFSNKCI